MKDSHVFAIAIPLVAAAEGMLTGMPVDTPEQWASEVGWWLNEQLDTGFVARAGRRLVDGRLELAAPSWPDDRRFYLQTADESNGLGWNRADEMVSSGLDPALARTLRSRGSLISRVTAVVDSRSLGPIVGQATVAWESGTTARLASCEAAAGAPASVSLSLMHAALRQAAVAGADSVVSSVATPYADLLGFRPGPDGELAVDTAFVDEDYAGAVRVYEEARRTPLPPGWQEQARQAAKSSVMLTFQQLSPPT